MSRPRRRGGLVALVVVVVVAVVLVGGLLLGDRYAAREAQQRTATRLQTELGTPEPPQVTIDGFPFLTQVAAQNLRSVHVVADGVGTNNGSEVVIAHADLVLTDITSEDRFVTMTAAHAEGTARLDHAELPDLTGLPLTYAGGGRFRLESSTRVLSVPVRATVTGGLVLDEPDQTLSLTQPDVEVVGVNLPGPAAQALLRAIVKPIPVSGLSFGLPTSTGAQDGSLPLGLRLTSVDARDDGLHAGVSGDDIVLRR